MRRPGRILAATLAGFLVTFACSLPAYAAPPTTGEIVGRLLDAGRPVQGATVGIPAGYNAPIVPNVVTDAGGRFRLAEVPVGSWDVQFTLPGGAMVQWYPHTTDGTAAVPVVVRAGQTTPITENALPHGAITGRIVSNRGVPVAGAYVGIWPDPRRVARTTTDAHGDYLLDYVPAGSYPVFIEPSLDAPEEWWPRTENSYSATPVTVTVGERTQVDERMLPLGAITGTYTSPDGPIAADVEANKSTSTRTTSSYSDGSYTLWLRPGDYTLYFDAEESSRDQWATGTLTEADAQVFTVRDGEVIHHDEHTIPYGKVSGRLVDYTGVPFTDPATVTFYNADGYTEAQTTTDSDGRWSVGIFPGTYKVAFLEDGSTQWAHGETDSAAADPITVGSGTSLTLDETFRPGTFVAVGAIVDGNAVTTFCATINAPGQDRNCTDNGYAYFTSMYPGTYEVTVEVPGYPPAVATVTAINNQSVEVDVPVTP